MELAELSTLEETEALEVVSDGFEDSYLLKSDFEIK